MSLLSLQQRSAQAFEEDSEKIFIRLLRCIERKNSEVKEQIRCEERTALSQTEKLLERLNQQIVEHRRGEAELEALSNTEDHIHFLQVKSWVWNMNWIYLFVLEVTILHKKQYGNSKRKEATFSLFIGCIGEFGPENIKIWVCLFTNTPTLPIWLTRAEL